MCSHKKAHCNNFQDHFSGVNNQETQIDDGTIFCYLFIFLIQGEENTVDNDYNKNESIEIWINGYDLDNLISKRISNTKTT